MFSRKGAKKTVRNAAVPCALRETSLGYVRVKVKTVIASLLLLASSGCVVVGGYSPEGGFWIWPGTIVLLVIGLILFLLFRRRR